MVQGSWTTTRPDETSHGRFSESWLTQEQELIDLFFREKVPLALRKLPLSKGDFQCTAEGCAAFARKILGSDDVWLVDNQGAASYTPICPSRNKIVQSRLDPVNEHILSLAHDIYGDLVPVTIRLGSFPLPVYVCPVIPGVIHIFQDFPKDCFPLRRELDMVRDLAAFVVKAASWPQPRQALSSDSWTATASAKLMDLASMNRLRQIEPRFAQKAAKPTSKLHLLDRLPLVLTHIDFAQVNLMVDPSDGYLTGVVDFDGARVEAFGICLFGVYEGFFRELRGARWRFLDQPAFQDSQEPGNPPRNVRGDATSHLLGHALGCYAARDDWARS